MADIDLPPADRLEQVLLGGPRRYTRLQAADRAGISPDLAKALWLALGFASMPDDEVAFTDEDVTALKHAAGLVEAGLIDADTLQSVTRMVGQSMSRLAEWQSQLLVSLLTERPQAIPDGDLAGFVASLEPVLRQVQVHVWRRHLAAASQRLLTADGTDPGSATLVVGFVDLAGYTSLSRQLAVPELSAVLEEFESLVAGLVAEQHGRIVKTIGDEVLYVVASPVGAAEIALRLQERAAASELLPPIRIGLALGTVLSRYGDVYGQVVNIASRLTGLARPATVLIDEQLAGALADDPRYQLSRLRPTSVRGYRHLNGYRLRLAE
jgi:adenylate cyclase